MCVHPQEQEMYAAGDGKGGGARGGKMGHKPLAVYLQLSDLGLGVDGTIQLGQQKGAQKLPLPSSCSASHTISSPC